MNFFDGQKLKAIFWQEGGNVTVGRSGVNLIVVNMQNGQMADVAWADVFYEDGKINSFNLALAEGVTLWKDK